jgi:S-adenosylmethionine-diacylgycerolhomoserine-N-methlytransferase
MFNDLKTILQFIFHKRGGANHRERLENYYVNQAENYDSYREKLLKGRREMFGSIPVKPGMVWVDYGGATGYSLTLFEDLSLFKKIYIVDLCEPLLQIARQRIDRLNLKNVELVCCPASEFKTEEPVDLATFSYSLTMIPDWLPTIDNCKKLMAPDGIIGVVDFFVPGKYAEAERMKASWFTRNFWPAWFDDQNVFISSYQLAYLEHKFSRLSLFEAATPLPYFLPNLKVPYFGFIGRNR